MAEYPQEYNSRGERNVSTQELECAVCTEHCTDSTLLGNCGTCYAPICREHHRDTVSTPAQGRTLFCKACQTIAGLAACDSCDSLFPAVELTKDPEYAIRECRACITRWRERQRIFKPVVSIREAVELAGKTA